jgi:hypothetical protein
MPVSADGTVSTDPVDVAINTLNTPILVKKSHSSHSHHVVRMMLILLDLSPVSYGKFSTRGVPVP